MLDAPKYIAVNTSSFLLSSMSRFVSALARPTAAAAGIVTGVWCGIEYSWRFQMTDRNAPHVNSKCDLAGLGATAYTMRPLKEPCRVRSALASDSCEDVYDAIIVGGGYAGLHCALSLAEKNKRVLLLEGKRIGCGASGRNGGDGIIGFQLPVDLMAKWTGSDETAKTLYSHSEMGYHRLKEIIHRYNIKCDAHEHGALTVAFRPPQDRMEESNSQQRQAIEDATVTALRQDSAAAASKFGEKLVVMSAKDIHDSGFVSPRFGHGFLEPRNLELNPLELALGLARACESTGKVTIHECSPVESITRSAAGDTWVVVTSLGAKCYGRNVVLATSYAPFKLSPWLSLKTVPLSTSMMLTTPIPDAKLDAVFTAKFAVFDERFALSYFRRYDGNRILFGALASALPFRNLGGKVGCCTPDPGMPAGTNNLQQNSVEKRLFDDFYATFPSLKDDNEPIRAERIWQGRLSAALPLFPLVGRQRNGLYYSLGYCGHGIVPTCAAGELLAAAIADGDNRFELWSTVPTSLPLGGPWGYAGSAALSQLQYVADQLAGRV